MKRSGIRILSVLWICAVGVGVFAMHRYSLTPVPTESIPVDQPDVVQLSATPGQATLVMFAHPQCPCTRASLGELARVMSLCHDRVNAFVVFLKYDAIHEPSEHTELWQQAEAIPQLTLVSDDDSRICRRFGATCSGETFLYDAARRLTFHGGITFSRGHAGPNAGAAAIVSILTENATVRASNPVYGCSLLGAPESQSDMP